MGSKKTEKKQSRRRGVQESENDPEGVNFFFEIDPDGSLTRKGGDPLRAREGGPDRSQKKTMGFLGYRSKADESFGGPLRVGEGG